MRTVGTVSRGVRCPVIREGDDLVKIVTDAIVACGKEQNIAFNDRDIVAVTEAVVARSQGNYATTEAIAKDCRAKFGTDTIGLTFPILSRNRIAICLKGIAKAFKKAYILMSYPSDEVGNHLFDEDLLDEKGVNPWSDVLDEKKYRELFGYVKGAFTGADPNGRMGKFELADKGTIFLDEIGDMPLYLQAKLLRVLQERTIIRIGSNQVIPIDVRVIAATNKDLKEMIREKKFREDLYYRLNVIPLKIPPLRERKEDIEELTDYFAGRYAGLLGKTVRHITESVRRALAACPWRGNVRELENVVEFMVNMMGEDGVLDERTLPRDFWDDAEEEQIRRAELQPEDGEMIVPLKELERLEIEKALRICGSTTDGKKEAAARLGIGVATLYRKLEQYSQNEK